jgi:hypothetical protein
VPSLASSRAIISWRGQGGGSDGSHHAGQQLTPHPFVAAQIAEVLTGQRVVLKHPSGSAPIIRRSTANRISQAVRGRSSRANH